MGDFENYFARIIYGFIAAAFLAGVLIAWILSSAF
jgi:hypothetical protein